MVHVEQELEKASRLEKQDLEQAKPISTEAARTAVEAAETTVEATGIAVVARIEAINEGLDLQMNSSDFEPSDELREDDHLQDL